MSEPSIESVTIPTRTIALDAGPPTLTRRLSTSGIVEIYLDKEERSLFASLVGAAKAYNQGEITLDDLNNNNNSNNNNQDDDSSSRRPKEPLVLRVAGGWVRDKLLQLQTHDVDIAVNTLMGVQTAQLVQAYLRKEQQKHEHEQRHAHLTAGKIGVIAANPAQSKHLETATMKIGCIEVDFCNLRSEEIYHSHSRIPTTSVVGTPLQDAMRRDFTLNALFYNLMSGRVEDWTSRGLQDLRLGCLVTPIDPERTFLDDPLRVLRAIRFAVRYQFQLDPQMEVAAKKPDIHHALHVKVSRERVGKELEAMLWSGKGANPVLALQIISRLQLAGSVFSLPIVGQNKVFSMQGFIHTNEYHDTDHDGVRARQIRQLGWGASVQFLDIFVQVAQAHDPIHAQHPDATTYDKRLSATAAFLLPFRKLTYKEKNKERYFLAISSVFRDGIKFKTADVQLITQLVESLDKMTALLTRAAAAQQQQGAPIQRLEAGLIVRSTKSLWATSLLMATILKLEEQTRGAKDTATENVDWIQVSIVLYETIVSMNLDGCWKMKPLMNGKALIKSLNLPQGPVVGQFSEEQVRWMLLNPEGSKEDCEAHLQSFKRKLEQDHQGQAGMSDGITSSPIAGSGRPHFDKKMHVESMDTK